MKRAFIFLNGNYSSIKTRLSSIKKDALIICADGGAQLALDNDISPDIVIGDLDSITDDIKEKLKILKVKFIRYPSEKDFADGELAIDYVLSKGYKDLIIFGVLGDRLDHLFSNLVQYSMVAKKAKIRVIENDTIYYFIYDDITINGSIGDEVSLIPIHTDIEEVKTTNLKYVLNNETLFLGSTRGISNVMKSKTAKISIKKGPMLVAHKSNKKVWGSKDVYF